MITVFIIVIASLAWWSTNSRPDRYRTVLLMRSRPTHPVTVSIRTRSMVPTQQVTNTPPSQPVTEPISNNSASSNSNGNRLIPIQEMDSIVDADMAMLDNNRLHFYRVIDATPSTSQASSQSNVTDSETPEEMEPASEAQIREMDSIVNAMEADITVQHERISPESVSATAKNEEYSQNNNQTGESDGVPSSSGNDVGDTDHSNKILIKLKYLNDTLKEVEGSLDELLKDFKWRHFATELSSESRVRLIFNGRVLVDEAATLRACGLHHHAVVHALVHPKRNSPVQPHPTETPTPTHSIVTEAPAAERSWDLENILMTLVSVALTVVWFFRCEYSNMFTASASVALFGLTMFYSVAIFGLYLSDTFHFDRRPEHLPNN
ncbi:unnamed protein product [Leptosia nina]|uniref:Ubiquitin-like domain-containing protein n=1 Tax=Leptosia nina TaxID=320188 RepID=A0AAV1J646_9NEOP